MVFLNQKFGQDHTHSNRSYPCFFSDPAPTPRDPVRIMLGPYATAENMAVLRAQYGLDQPLPM